VLFRVFGQALDRNCNKCFSRVGNIKILRFWKIGNVE